MADPISIVGAVAAAIQSVKAVVKTIDTIREGPGTLKDIRSDLDTLARILQQLEKASTAGNNDRLLFAEVDLAMQDCEVACTTLKQQLEHWMRHSETRVGAWADGLRVRMFSQERIEVLRARLRDCKGTLDVALSTATFIAIAKNEDNSDDRALTLELPERRLQQKLVRAETEERVIASNLQQVAIVPSTASEDEEEGRQALLQELRYRQASNAVFRKICEEAMARLSYERTGHKIRGVKAERESFAVAGMFNVTDEQAKVNLDISDIRAEDSSFAGAGIFNNVDFGKLRQSMQQASKARSSGSEVTVQGAITSD